MSVSDKDKGYKKLLAKVMGPKPSVKVGIFGAKGSEQHEGSALSVLEIATFHEFGLGVPERSFLRAWCDENGPAAEAFLAKQCEKALAGELTWEQVLERLGLYCVAGIQTKISNNIPPPLADETIKRKGSSVALIDTGQLRSSITYEVTKGGE